MNFLKFLMLLREEKVQIIQNKNYLIRKITKLTEVIYDYKELKDAGIFANLKNEIKEKRNLLNKLEKIEKKVMKIEDKSKPIPIELIKEFYNIYEKEGKEDEQK